MSDHKEPKDSEEGLTDLLKKWDAPDATESLNSRVLASYRRQFAAQGRWSWLAMLNRPLFVPMPLAAVFLLCFGLCLWLAVRKNAALSPLETMPAHVPTRFIELPIVQEREVLRVVYREPSARRPQPAEKKEPLQPPKPTATPLRLPVDLAAFRPVQEIKMEIIAGGQKQ